MPKVTEAHLEARREQILDAAAACFARKGFHQTTMQDICQEAELSPGAIYRYFHSKEEIIEAICGGESLQQSLDLIKAAKEREDTLQVFDELANAFFSTLEDSDVDVKIRLSVQLWAEALSNPPIMEMLRSNFDSVRGAFTEIIHQAQKRGDINPALDPDAVARVMISLFDGLLLQKGMDPDVDVWKYVAVVKAMLDGSFWQGERPEESSPEA
ncbi:MAG: TetR/AcrR family transcriptional regulator [Candidatus Bipolaricaulia bacterium]